MGSGNARPLNSDANNKTDNGFIAIPTPHENFQEKKTIKIVTRSVVNVEAAPLSPPRTPPTTTVTATTSATSIISTKEPSNEERLKAALGIPLIDSNDGIYGGFLVETNLKFDLSVPSNAVEGAICVVNVILVMVRAFINRNKFIKALEARVVGIEASTRSLKERSPSILEASLPALRVLVELLVDFKAFVTYITKKPDGFFDRMVSFFRAKSDLENLADFDNLFTRALSDLSVPLQADQLRLMEEQRNTLQDLTASVERVLAKLDETRVLSISKRVLTDEEALAFWMECLPDKFQVSISDFIAALFLYLTEVKGMRVTKKNVAGLVTIVNLGDIGDEGVEEDPDESVDARECNLLFRALPFNYPSMSLSDAINVVRDFVAERRKKDLKSVLDNRALVERHREAGALAAAAGSAQRTKAEEEFLDNVGSMNYCRFDCEAHVAGGKMRRSTGGGIVEIRPDVQTLYCVENGHLHVFGRDAATHAEVAWTGHLYQDMSVVLEMPPDVVATKEKEGGESKNISAAGAFRGNLFVTHCVLPTGLRAVLLRLRSARRWEGYWEQTPCMWCYEEQALVPIPDAETLRGDMFFFMEERPTSDPTVNAVSAISDDSVGVAIWHGTISKEKASFVKQYIGQHVATYEGAVTELTAASGLRQISGKWQINNGEYGVDEGGFKLWELMEEGEEEPSDVM